MEFEELRVHVGNELKRRFWEHGAMSLVAHNRARFDGWLKIELVAILAQRCSDVEPSFKLTKGRAAARVPGWVVEAACLPTDFPFDYTKHGSGNLDDEVRSMRRTIKRLRKGKGQDQAAVFFVVYPFGDLHEDAWAPRRARIEKSLGGPLVEDRFSFQGSVTGRLCAGLVQDKVKPAPAPKEKPVQRPRKHPVPA